MLRERLKTLVRVAQVVLLVGLLPLAVPAADRPGGMAADRHKAKGVACTTCHGNTKKPAMVEAEKCLSCHGPADAVAKKTAQVKPENPHDSPHWGAQIECSVCHRQHEKTVDWCAHCHNYGFKVP